MKYQKILHDETVNFQLKALYILCIEHREDKNFTIKQVASYSPLCLCSVEKYFMQLEELGYVKRERVKSITPNFMDSQWIFEVEK